MTSTLTRRLVVILHADVVDSTALVQADETLAHARIRDAFTRFSDTINRYNGVAHEVRGDALIAEFARASDAITASIAFQTANASHNDRLPDEIRPKLRVGIALGEAVVADNTVTGQGAIMAQRLEQLAAPGGIVIQGAVYETLPKRLPFDYGYMGERKLKGFNEPVRAYTVALKSQAAVPEPEVQYQREAKGPGSDKPSLAVLPFVNMSSDSEQECFVDGMTSSVTSGCIHGRPTRSNFAYATQLFRSYDPPGAEGLWKFPSMAGVGIPSGRQLPIAVKRQSDWFWPRLFHETQTAPGGLGEPTGKSLRAPGTPYAGVNAGDTDYRRLCPRVTMGSRLAWPRRR